ncbi:MAG: fibronectin type III domain-containing protein [Planctomycetes bacterium]|nr:fibronectin type III domain-containing protein [Planctomycetota bacterium]
MTRLVRRFVGFMMLAPLLAASECSKEDEDSSTPTSPPTAPSGLIAVASSSTSVDLSWTDNSADETGFEIYRAPDAVTFALIATTVANVVAYSNTGLTASTTYTYRVRAVNDAGGSAFTSDVNVTTPATITAPTGLLGTVTGATQVTLTWSYTPPAPTDFRIERSPDNVVFAEIGNTPDGVTLTFNDTAAIVGTNYYRVRARVGAAYSSYSGTVVVVLSAPIAPTALSASPISSGSIKLTWTDNSNNEQGFRVYRSFTGASGTYILRATVSPNTTTYTDSGLFPSTTYWYLVRSFNAIAESSDSNTALATTFSGDWLELAGSGSTGGISSTTSNSSWPSVAINSVGRAVVVWQETVMGVDQIYLAVWDTVVAAWRGVLVNGIQSAITVDTTSNLITGVTFAPQQMSNTGNGISLASGDAQEPVITYNASLDAFFIVWQEYRNGEWEIVARKMDNLTYQAVLGFYKAEWDDVAHADLPADNATYANGNIDDNVTTLPATIVVSTGGAVASIRPQAFLTTAQLYVAWQEFTGGNWEIFAAQVAPVGFAVTNVDGAFGPGFQVSITANSSLYPSIVSSGGIVFVFWQEWDGADWEIHSRRSSGGSWDETEAGSATGGGISNNAGDSQHPKAAVDSLGVPYVVWDDNTASSNNHEIYIVKRNVGVGWLPINDTTITSNSGGGISNSSGASLFPSITIDGGNNVYVAWHDSAPGNWDIFVKQYNVAVPDEADSWVSMGSSDVPPGVSNNSGSSLLPTIRVSSGGVVYLVWEDDTNGNYETYLRRW